MTLLGDEAIREANQIPPEEYGAEPDWWFRVSENVAHRAEQNMVRLMFKWGEEVCPHYSSVQRVGGKVLRKDCFQCRQELKAEVKDE